MRRPRRVILATALLTCIALPRTTPARSWRVEQDGTGAFTTIQPAVDAAASGDTILIGPGRYQDMQSVVIGGYNTQIVVHSLPEKSLTYIGAGADRVTIGPEAYCPISYGPCGIFHSGRQRIVVRDIEFINLYMGISSYFDVEVEDCTFTGNNAGVSLCASTGFIDGSINNCLFDDGQDLHGGIVVWSGGNVIVDGCVFRDADFSFNGTLNAQVRNCEIYGRAGGFYHSNGEFVNNTVELATSPGATAVYITDACQVAIVGNEISGGWYNICASGTNVTIDLVDNILLGAKDFTIKCTSYASISGHGNHILLGDGHFAVRLFAYGNAHPASVDLRNNYWGTDDPEQIAAWIMDGNDDPFVDMVVDYLPFSDVPLPAEATTWSDLKALYKGR